MTRIEPPAHVVGAFGLTGTPVPLPGGAGLSWRVGDAVLKPHVSPEYQAWLGTDIAGIRQDGFHLPTVLRTLDGAWVAHGWGALTLIPGSSLSGGQADWAIVIAAGRALHAATAQLPRPPFLRSRTDGWARADRSTWDHHTIKVPAELEELVSRLRRAFAPLGPSQLIHGDLTTNVLVAPRTSPGIIDFSPYWRSPQYAEGIVVADALCWHAAPPDLHLSLGVPLAAVARGLHFRLLTSIEMDPRSEPATRIEEDVRRYQIVMDSIGL